MPRRASNENEQDKSQRLPDSSMNANVTARPKDIPAADQGGEAADLVATQFDYGTMNADDARKSGYTDENGRAVSKAVKDPVGSPTGAYTDVGAGRSSAVVSKKNTGPAQH